MLPFLFLWYKRFMYTKIKSLFTKEPVTQREITLPTRHTLSLRLGDLTEESVDAIVNAANSGLAHGGGVAGAIVRKGGYDIQDESDRVGKVKVGSAAITGAGQLKASFVIHAVGPVWAGQGPEESDALLASATTASLEIARERGLNTIAFPPMPRAIYASLLSTGKPMIPSRRSGTLVFPANVS
ncbi:MAG: macro domain-containing protein [Alphaproteobacteria bacterium]|nr:MAG: macro domain-containing protein [Alphaproteobacteria bacterium]